MYEMIQINAELSFLIQSLFQVVSHLRHLKSPADHVVNNGAWGPSPTRGAASPHLINACLRPPVSLRASHLSVLSRLAPFTMDLAYSYDHIINTDDRSATPTPPNPSSSNDDTTSTDPTTPRPTQSQPARQNLQTEFQETFKAFSASPWGAKLGGLWGNVRKQGESYYEEAVREAEAARIDALKGLTDIREGIVGRVRSLSINEKEALQDAKSTAEQPRTPVPGEETVPPPTHDPSTSRDKATDADIQDTETFIERFKAEAAKRLKDVQKAEDAADEALLRFGTNIRNFLRDAVAVTAPDDSEQPGEVLFESKDASGKRTIHTSRMDAQLYMIHTTKDGFMQDPTDSGAQWEEFKSGFDAEKRTDEIAKDLDKYPELRRTMEALVPEKVEYKDFWGRYYFLRRALEAQEEKRRELLQGPYPAPPLYPFNQKQTS